MKLKWKINSATHATSNLGRLSFWVSDLLLNPNKDGTHQYEIRHFTNLTNGRSNQALCIGMINANDINEAVALADEFIFGKEETESENKIGISLPDGSTLVLETKDEGGDYPGAWIYRVSPDTSTETDIAVVEKTKDNIGLVSVYAYGDTNNDDWTEKTVINVSDIK